MKEAPCVVRKVRFVLAQNCVDSRRELRQRFAMNGFEMAREKMVGDQIDEYRRKPARRLRKPRDAYLDVVLNRAECVETSMQPDSGLNAAWQLRWNGALDEVAEKPADDVQRVC